MTIHKVEDEVRRQIGPKQACLFCKKLILSNLRRGEWECREGETVTEPSAEVCEKWRYVA